MSKFTADINKFVAKAKENGRRLKQGLILEIGAQIVRKTPRDTGFAKNNWQYGFNQIPQGTVPLGTASIFETGQRVAISSEFGIDYIVNNANYIEFLENGRSNQAPNGMVKTTLADLDRIIAREVNEL